jgi:hypothetical protein
VVSGSLGTGGLLVVVCGTETHWVLRLTVQSSCGFRNPVIWFLVGFLVPQVTGAKRGLS